MGTTTPTAEEIANIRLLLGVLEAGFSDPTITALWGLVSAASNTFMQIQATTALCLQNALTSVASYHDMTTGNTSEKLSQVFDNLQKLLGLYKPALDIVLRIKPQVAIGSVRAGRGAQTVPFNNAGGEEFVTWLDVWGEHSTS